MKFGAIASLLACTAAASSVFDSELPTHHLYKRADSVVAQGLYNISNSTTVLANDIASFSTKTLLKLQNATNAALSTINTANTEIKGIDPLSQDDAVALIPIISALAKTVNSTIATTISQKAAFGGVAPVVLDSLQKQFNATTTLTATITGKLPSNLVASAATLSAPIFASLKMGIAAYNSTNPQLDQTVYYSAAVSAASFSYTTITVAALAVVASLVQI